MYFPRRLISLLLIAAMLFSLSCEAFAETITLPAALEEIGEEAFYGDESLDEVVVPYGATAIGPRAFAYSGVKRITIPDTVTQIAEDAFEGTADVTILSSADSYACKYADTNGLAWASDNSHYVNEELAQRLSLIADAKNIGSIIPDEPDLSTVSTEGITDKEALALVEQYNALQLELAEVHGSYSDSVNQLISSFDSLADSMLDSGVQIGDSASFTVGDITFTIPPELMDLIGDDYEVISSSFTEDGDVQIEISSGGTVYRLKGNEDGLSLQDSQGNLTLMSAASFLAPNTPAITNMERVRAIVSDIGNWMGLIGNRISEGIEQLENELSIIEKQQRVFSKMRSLGGSDAQLFARREAAALLHASSVRTALSGLKNLSGVFSALSLHGNFTSIQSDIALFDYLAEVEAHGHPTAKDNEDPDMRILAADMMNNLSQARRVCIAHCASSTLGLVTDLADIMSNILILLPGAQAAAAVDKLSIYAARATLSVIVGATQIIMGGDLSARERFIREADAELHTLSIRGSVTDGKTGQPLSGVTVTLDGSRTETTDSNGRYSFSDVAQGAHSLRFEKTGYDVATAQLAEGQYTRDQSMTAKTYTLSGTVTDSATGAALSGVTVTLDGSRTASTGADGQYSFSDVAQGAHSLRFEKTGYDVATAQLAEGQYTRDQSMTAKTYTLSGTVVGQSTGAGIAGVTVTLDDGRTTVTSASGQYSFSKVSSGIHSVTAEKMNYNVTSVDVFVSNHDKYQKIILTSENVPKIEFNSAFWEWCVSQFDGTYDAEKDEIVYDGELSKEEAEAVTEIYCRENGFSSLQGIKYFVNLEILGCHHNNLTSLDVSGLKKLNTIFCNNNQLQSVDLSGCTALSVFECEVNQLTHLNLSGYKELTNVSIYNNPLTDLNLAGCTSLSKLYVDGGVLTTLNVSNCINLERLSCHHNYLTSLNLSGCRKLKTLYCHNNQLKSIDVSDCPLLETLEFEHNLVQNLDLSGYSALKQLGCTNNPLRSLNLSNCSSLPKLDAGGMQLTSLILSGCSALTELACSDNKLTSLDVSDCTMLENLHCFNNKLTRLNVSGCNALTELICFNNALTTLDVSDCTALVKLNASDCQLTSIDASGCTALERLLCENNKLTSLDVSGLTALAELICYENQLTSLDVSGCTALERLNAETNQLPTLDVSECTALTKLFCAGNQLTSLDVSGLTALTDLVCPGNPLTSLVCVGNQLTSLDLSGFATLTELVCRETPLTSLNLSDCEALTTLDCSHNQLSALDVSHNRALTKLVCPQNQLTSLDVSGLNTLTELVCYENQLTSLNVSGCSALQILNAHTNQLPALSVSGFSTLTKLVCAGNQLISLDLTGLTALTELVCAGNQLTSIDVSDCPNLTDANIQCDSGVQIIRK